MKPYIRSIPFPLGATVVGIVTMMFSIFVVSMCSLYLHDQTQLHTSYCARWNSTEEVQISNLLDEAIHLLCSHDEKVMYGSIVVIVDAVLLFLSAIGLVYGVWKNSGVHMVSYLLLLGIQIFFAFAACVAVGVTVSSQLLVKVIAAAGLTLAVPVFFWIVVFYHMLGTRQHTVGGCSEVGTSKTSEDIPTSTTCSTVRLLIEDDVPSTALDTPENTKFIRQPSPIMKINPIVVERLSVVKEETPTIDVEEIPKSDDVTPEEVQPKMEEELLPPSKPENSDEINDADNAPEVSEKPDETNACLRPVASSEPETHEHENKDSDLKDDTKIDEGIEVTDSQDTDDANVVADADVTNTNAEKDDADDATIVTDAPPQDTEGNV